MLESALDDAINAEFGLVLVTPSYHHAKQLRRKLYAAREKLRQQGSNEFDCLSFIPQSNGELWLIRRDVKPEKVLPEFTSRPLLREELPPRILARGKRKSGLLTMWELSQQGRKP